MGNSRHCATTTSGAPRESQKDADRIRRALLRLSPQSVHRSLHCQLYSGRKRSHGSLARSLAFPISDRALGSAIAISFVEASSGLEEFRVFIVGKHGICALRNRRLRLEAYQRRAVRIDLNSFECWRRKRPTSRYSQRRDLSRRVLPHPLRNETPE
jgi:hypothetical protein